MWCALAAVCVIMAAEKWDPAIPMSFSPDHNGTWICVCVQIYCLKNDSLPYFPCVSVCLQYNFVGRILGPRGLTAKQLEAETGCKIMVRGKSSMRDKKKVRVLPYMRNERQKNNVFPVPYCSSPSILTCTVICYTITWTMYRLPSCCRVAAFRHLIVLIAECFAVEGTQAGVKQTAKARGSLYFQTCWAVVGDTKG